MRTRILRFAAAVLGAACVGRAAVVTLEATDDAWVNGNTSARDTNYGAETRGVLRNDDSADWAQNHPLFKFDTSAIAGTLNPGQAVEVTSVRMRFYTSVINWPASPTNFSDVVMYRNTSDFSEGTVTWNSKPTTDAAEVARLTYFGLAGNPTYFTGTNTISSGGWLEFESENVKELVEGWVNGTVPNYGITIRGGENHTGSNRSLSLQSKEHSNASVHPEIIVNYNVVAITQTVASSADDAWINGNTPSVGTNYGAWTTAILRNDNSASWAQNHPLFKFDLSAFDSILQSGESIEVTDVQLKLYRTAAGWVASPTNFSDVVMYRNTADFDEASVTWDTAPPVDANEVDRLTYFGTIGNEVYFTGTNAVDDSAAWLVFESAAVEDLVEGWVNGTIPNHGFTLRGGTNYTGGNRTFRFATKEEANSAYHPQLVIGFNIVPGAPAYANWAASYLITGGPADDDDGDGLSNLAEFGLGGDPTNAADKGTAPVMEYGGGSATYTHVAWAEESDVSYVVDWTQDLAYGPWASSGLAVSTNVTGEVFDEISYGIDAGDKDKLFFRLRISRP